MANRSHCGGWPPPQHPPTQGHNMGADFRRLQSFPNAAGHMGAQGSPWPPMSTGVPFLQNSPRASSPNFHQFSPREPPGPSPGHGGYKIVHLANAGPGFNNSPGWSSYPRGYPVMAPSPRATAMSPTITICSQNFAPASGHGTQGSAVAVGLPGQGQQGGGVRHGVYVQGQEARGSSEAHPRSSEVHTDASAKPLFHSWIGDGPKDASSSQSPGDSASSGLEASLRPKSGNVGVPRSSDLYRLVEEVEESISKILAKTNLQISAGTEWSVCPFYPHHVVPPKALLRHSLQCPSSPAGTVEASSLLDCLQYIYTSHQDPNKTLSCEKGTSNRYLGPEFSKNYVTLSLEDAALARIRSSTTRRSNSGIVKEEPGEKDNLNSSGISRGVYTTFSGKAGIADWNEKLEFQTVTFRRGRHEFDPMGSFFFYKGAPGVVLTSSSYHSAKSSSDSISAIPQYLRKELVTKSNLTVGCVKSVGGEAFLPSMVWMLEKEVETWTDMPTQCSRVVLQAATGLGRMRKDLIVDWLLLHSPTYGVVLDVAMATHISCLVELCLKSLRTQSLLLLEQKYGKGMTLSCDSRVVECPVSAESCAWVASWLSHLYGPARSKTVVFDILKFSVKYCGRSLSVVPLDLHLNKVVSNTLEKIEDVKGVVAGKSEDVVDRDRTLRRTDERSLQTSEVVCMESSLELREVVAAMDALYERANFDRYIRSWMSWKSITKPQLVAEYDMAVKSADDERARRPTYRAVCEHDGLTWQRSNQEEKRNKTKAELLAEERDYKRRRMSYRGKKLKRTPLQVLHDIIEGHMAEIAEAGGIGCFSKQPSNSPPITHMDIQSDQRMQKSNPSQSDVKPIVGSGYHRTMASSDRAGYVPSPMTDTKRLQQ